MSLRHARLMPVSDSQSRDGRIAQLWSLDTACSFRRSVRDIVAGTLQRRDQQTRTRRLCLRRQQCRESHEIVRATQHSQGHPTTDGQVCLDCKYA